MPIWFVLVASGLYVALLFGVAWYGDRISAKRGGAVVGRRGQPVLYALTLATYATSWSFYGSVGRAATHGFDFFAIYLGPCLLLIFGRRIVVRMIDISKAQNLTSIADFIGSRYGKSQRLAAMVTIAATLGLLPYIALQLKAIAASYAVLTGRAADAATLHPIWLDPALVAAVALALFSILFGVRHIHASEHHRGLMLAIAIESVIKLAAFLLVATFIVYGLSGGVGALFDRAAADPRLAQLLVLDPAEPPWLVNTILAGLMILCLPQIFHVLVVENEARSDVRVASWLFPGYLLALSPLMMPIAIVGLLAFADASVDPDTFVIRLPMMAGHPGIALIAFIGGLSAATAMVVVSTVALATMICNDAVMPLLLRIPALRLAGRGDDRTGLLLGVRRLAVIVVLLLAYATFRAIGDTAALVSMGLVTFVAIAQFAPALLGGLFWAGGRRNGAIGGLSVGLAVWAYTLMLPLLATSGLLTADWLQHGPAGLGFLRPQALFGLGRLDPVSHAAIWSLAANILVYIALSLAARPSLVERLQAGVFTAASPAPTGDSRAWSSSTTSADLERLVARFVGPDKAGAAFGARRLAGQDPGPDLPADLETVRFAERLLAGAIGAASARVVVATALETKTFSRADAMAMLDQASRAIRLSRELLLATLENMIQGICVFDASLRVTAWNERLLRLLELPDDLIQVGTDLSDITRFNVARGEYSARDIQAQLNNRDLSRQTWPYSYERQRLDGTVIEVTFNPIPDGRGYVATCTDITERTRTATALQAAKEGLEQRVQERTMALEEQARALQAAKGEAERANLSKTRFLAGITHDLLQPISAARLFVSTLTERMADPAVIKIADPFDQELVGNIDLTLRSIEGLLGDLLDISRLDSCGVRPEPVDFPISRLQSALTVEFSAMARQHGLSLRVVASKLLVRSDPVLLRRILQNFLSNAVRYTPEGRILLGCRRRGGRVAIEVWDTGPGIPADKLEEVFLEFRRLDTAKVLSRGFGLGLGLAIVDRLARIMDHPVRVRSNPGRGTCFSVDVPVGIAAALPLAGAAADRPMAWAGDLSDTSVLCIDNDRAILAGMRGLLLGWGCRVSLADDTATARAAFLADPPDIIIADQHLDHATTGLDIVDRLVAEHAAAPACIIVSADRGEALSEAVQARGHAILHKPIRPAALRALMAQLRRRSPTVVGD